jgi:hypothetical protein
MTTKSLLHKILQGILYTQDESKQNHVRVGGLQEKKRQQSESSIDSAANAQVLKQKQVQGRIHHIPININTECQ